MFIHRWYLVYIVKSPARLLFKLDNGFRVNYAENKQPEMK